MSVEILRSFLLWSGIINYGFLIIWAMMMVFARGWLHQKARWYGISPEQFDLTQFAGIVFYKICIFMFFLIPYVSLRIVT